MAQILSIIISIILVLHGLIHLMGFVTYWQLADLSELPYKTTLANGRFDVGDAGIRVYGLLWLILVIAFAIAALGLVTSQPWARSVILITSIASLIVTALDWQVTYAGVLVNLVLILVFGLVPQFVGG